MKKYIKPVMKSVVLEEATMIAASIGGVTNGSNLGGDTKDDGYDEDNQFVKRESLWDDMW